MSHKSLPIFHYSSLSFGATTAYLSNWKKCTSFPFHDQRWHHFFSYFSVTKLKSFVEVTFILAKITLFKVKQAVWSIILATFALNGLYIKTIIVRNNFLTYIIEIPVIFWPLQIDMNPRSYCLVIMNLCVSKVTVSSYGY